MLIAIDGTEYFSSQKIHCQNCSHRELANGKTQYFHTVLTPVIVQAGHENVVSDPPTPQDGHEKQDCEIEAGKRWVETYGEYYAKWNVALLGEDLFSRPRGPGNLPPASMEWKTWRNLHLSLCQLVASTRRP